MIILSVAIIDAQFREYESPGFKGNSKDLFKVVDYSTDYDWLRIKRNRIIHSDPNDPTLNLEAYADKENDLKSDARKAIELVFRFIFLSPGT